VLTGIHVLLSYMCNLECDHCFVYSSPTSGGTFTLAQLRGLMEEAARISSVEWIYFEGGEPFLFYPLMREGIRMARAKGFQVGLVTNAYYGTGEEDARIWLKPLVDLGVSLISISDDSFHFGGEGESPGQIVRKAAAALGIAENSISIDKPSAESCLERDQARGEEITRGYAMFRGRAAEKLAPGMPTKPWRELDECLYEDLSSPKRVHVDSYGHVHICQGLSMGNMWKTPLSSMVRSYDAGVHPVCGPLRRGGPAQLALEYDIEPEDGYVDACHFCYLVRLALLKRFPEYLGPRQVYGLEEDTVECGAG
jgi:hypothetical protein